MNVPSRACHCLSYLSPLSLASVAVSVRAWVFLSSLSAVQLPGTTPVRASHSMSSLDSVRGSPYQRSMTPGTATTEPEQGKNPHSFSAKSLSLESMAMRSKT